MKILILALLGVVFVITTSADESLPKDWEGFKKYHGKTYSLEEDELRKEIFSSNKALVDLHNEKYAKGEVPYSIGLNQFSDMVISIFI